MSTSSLRSLARKRGLVIMKGGPDPDRARRHRESMTMERALKDPRMAAAYILRDRAENSLIDFIRLTWHVLEPGQPLRVGWAMGAIAEHLEAVHRGQIRNLLINCPPGFSKSTLVNVFFPAWEWGPRSRADLRYISWAYGEHLTKRDNEKCAKLIDSPLYQALWGGRFAWDPRQNEKTYYKNTREGFRVATTVKGMGTGERADRLIIDDPHSVMGADSDAERKYTISWFGGTLPSRVRNANPFEEQVEGVKVVPSSTIVIMQRVHHEDVAGVIMAQELNYEHLLIEMEYEGQHHPARSRKSKKDPQRGAWRGSSIGYEDPREKMVAVVDAYHIAQHATHEPVEGDCPRCVWIRIARDIATLADPVRYSRAAVEELREQLILKQGTNASASQLRQWPNEGQGDMFPVALWEYCDASEVPPSRVGMDVRGWDLAAVESMRSDGTCAVKLRWGTDRTFYVLDAERVRLGPGGVKDFRDRIRKTDGPLVVQDFPRDPGQAGVDQVQVFAAEDPTTTTRSSPESGKKAVRAMPMSGMQNHRRIKLVRGPWNREFVDEYKDFPVGTFNGLVDAGSRGFNRLASMPALQIPGGSVQVDGHEGKREPNTPSANKRDEKRAARPELDDFDEDGKSVW